MSRVRHYCNNLRHMKSYPQRVRVIENPVEYAERAAPSPIPHVSDEAARRLLYVSGMCIRKVERSGARYLPIRHILLS